MGLNIHFEPNPDHIVGYLYHDMQCIPKFVGRSSVSQIQWYPQVSYPMVKPSDIHQIYLNK